MKIKLFSLLTSLSIIYGCSNEDLETGNINLSDDKTSPKVEFVRLVDNDSREAGVLNFEADSPEANLKWIVADGCNLDTTQTVVKLTDGKGSIPIFWDKKLEEDNYGPSDMAFKAFVMITTDGQSQSFPLIWATEVDSVKLAERAAIQSRSTGVMPRATSMTFIPPTVAMNDREGATMALKYSGEGVVIMDYSNFISTIHHVDVRPLPVFLGGDGNTGTRYQQLNFKWIENEGPAPSAFDVIVRAESDDGYAKEGHVTWGANAPTLTLQPSDVRVPATKGIYATVIVNTNQETWKAFSNQTWVRAVPQLGMAGSSVSFDVDANPNMVERVARITVEAGGLTKYITVTQAAASAATLTVTPLAQVIPAEGGTVSSTVTATDAWTVTNNAPSWLTVSPITGNGNGTISYTAAANTTSSARTATVVVTLGTLTQTVSITQNPQASTGTLIFDKYMPKDDISEFGGEITVNFKGDYNGDIIVRAKTDGNPELATGIGRRQDGVRLTIPRMMNSGTRVLFLNIV